MAGLFAAGAIISLASLLAGDTALGTGLRTCAAAVATLVGIIAAYLTALIGGAIDGVHHLFGIALGDLDIAEFLQQVDMAHLLFAAVDMMIEKLHDLSGIETISLTEVDEETAISGLSLMTAASTADAALAVALLVLTVTALARRLLNDRRVLVILQELTEGDGDHLLDEVFLIEIFKLAVDIVHIRGDLLLVDIRLHDVVHRLVELFLADLLGRGQRAVDKLLADLLLNLTDLPFLFRMDNADRRTLLARTARTATAVSIALDIIGQTVVDDMREILYIEAAGSDIGGNEELHRMLAEFLHRQVTLLLAEVTVEGLGVVAVLDELVGNLLRLELRTAEDDGEDTRVIVYDTLQGQILVLGVNEIVDVVDMLGALITAADNDLLIVVEILLRDLLNLLAHRGGEEERVVVLGQLLEDGVDTLGEAHVQHLIGLVEDDIADVVELRHATVDEVDETARRGDNDLHALLQLADLRHDVGTAVDGHDMKAMDILGKSVEIIGDLQTELTRGREDDGLRRLRLSIGLLQHGEAISGRLARTGLRQCDDIILIA